MKKIIKISQEQIHEMVKTTIQNIIKEEWNGDRFTYNNFTDEGNGGIEEYGRNIADLLLGLGGDPDSLHAVGEETAENLLKEKEKTLKPFIEGLIAVYKSDHNTSSKTPQDIYNQYGIVRN